MNLQGIMLNKISQAKTNAIRCHLYVESKNKTEKLNIDTENRLVVARGGRGWVKCMKMVKRYKYLVIK